MIREFQTSDIEQVMRSWLIGNEDAHPFIPKEYWRSHYNEVQEAILQAKVFVYAADKKIHGFIGIIDGYIAGIFVDKSYRSCGIGKQLLEYVKQSHSVLSLGVYQKNTRAVDFYRREGFVIVSEQIDEDTGEVDLTMSWERNRSPNCFWIGGTRKGFEKDERDKFYKTT